MSGPDRRPSWLPWAAAASVVTVLNLCLLVLNAGISTEAESGGPWLQALAAVAYLATTVVGSLVLSRHPRHPIGWVCGLGGIGMAVAALASEYPVYALFESPVTLPGAQAVAWLGSWLWWLAFGGTLTFLFLLFPDGRLPSRRWRPVVLIASVNLAVLATGHTLAPGPLHGEYSYAVNPLGVEAAAGLLEGFRSAGWMLITFNLLVAVGALVGRLVRSGGERRQQMKWLAYSASICALALPAWAVTGSSGAGAPVPVQVLEGLAFLGVPVSAGIAILRHRLYDIDVVINKTLVVGALAAFITAVYGIVVAGVGALVNSTADVPLSFAATALVAIAFQPVRQKLQTISNRLVYGQRLTPYEAVTRFSERMSRILAPHDVLPEMAEAAANGVGGNCARARLFHPKGLVEEVIWPDPTATAFARTVPIVHRGATVGEISVGKPRGETMTERDEELLADLALQAGPVLANIGLTLELRASLDELRASRQRIVAAEDQQRRRVERDLHDGAQQTLVSTSAKLGLAMRLMGDDPVRSTDLLDEVGAGISEAVDQLRDLARGIFPPLLTQRGVAAALEMHLLKAGIDAQLDVTGTGPVRFSHEVEAAFYFCAIEALQNVSKHAPGAAVAIRLCVDDDGVEMEVTDRGPGFDPQRVHLGTGLQNMTDRIEAIGGRLVIDTSVGSGTSVRARVALPDAIAARGPDARHTGQFTGNAAPEPTRAPAPAGETAR